MASIGDFLPEIVGAGVGIGVGFATANPALGVAAGGATMGIVGKLQSAQSEADAAEANAAIKNAQAAELMNREIGNESLLREQSAYNQDEIINAGYGGSGIGAALRYKSNIEYNIANNRREAEFKASMLRAGAQIDTNLASDKLTAGYLGAAGSLLGTAGTLYAVNKKDNSDPDDLTSLHYKTFGSPAIPDETYGYTQSPLGNPDSAGNYDYTRGY